MLSDPDPAKMNKNLIVPPSNQHLPLKKQSASAKYDSRDIEELSAFVKKRDGLPPKVIQVTKTVAVQIPIPIQGEIFNQQYYQASKQLPIFLQENPIHIQPKKMTTQKPVTPMRINSSEMHAVKNSIWQQNFPPNTVPKRNKAATTTQAPELAPTSGSITILQNPVTKAVNIEIPWNAAMKEGFLDELSKNPNPLLFSLNLLPNQISDPSSYGVSQTSVLNNFSSASGSPPSSYSASIDGSAHTFSPENSSPSLGQTQIHDSQTPSTFNELLYSQQYSDGLSSASNHSHRIRYHTKKPHIISHGGNSIYEQRRHRKPSKPIDFSKQQDVTNAGSLFEHDFSFYLQHFNVPQNTIFTNSDIQAALREYEKRVEKDLTHERVDSSGSDSDTSYSMDTSFIVDSPLTLATTTPRTSRLRQSQSSSTPIYTTLRTKRKKKIAKFTIKKGV